MKLTHMTDDEITYVKWSLGLRQSEIHSRLASKWKLMQRIADCAVDGMIQVDESGMDCDGVQYGGKLHKIPATLAAYDKLGCDIGEWADGPFSLYIMSAKDMQEYDGYHSRDLGSEAHEDGHPWVIYA